MVLPVDGDHGVGGYESVDWGFGAGYHELHGA